MLSRGDWSDEKGRLCFQQVSRTFENRADVIVTLTVTDTLTGESSTIGVTEGHPFWVVDTGHTGAVPLADLATSELGGGAGYLTDSTGSGAKAASTGWVYAGDLVEGVTLATASGARQVVTSVTHTTGATRTYNFEVRCTHTYFAGQHLAWVHNSSREVPSLPTGDSKAGWAHIEGRHVTGTIPPKPGERSDMFPRETTRADIVKLVKKVVKTGVRISDNSRAVQVFEKRTSVRGFKARFRVAVGPNNSVITAHPVGRGCH